MNNVRTILLALLCAALPVVAFPASIFGLLPTASMTPKGVVSLQYYSLGLGGPQADSTSLSSAYMGVTSRLEVDITRVNSRPQRGQTMYSAEYLIWREDKSTPALAIGRQDVLGDFGGPSDYLALLKTIAPVKESPYPSIGLHLGHPISERNSRFFGGVQCTLSKELSVSALAYGDARTYCATCSIPKTPFTLKAGYVDHNRWLGVQCDLALF